MSISITVNGSPVRIRRDRILLTDFELLKKNEFIRRRKIRLNQVRQQSKNIANQVRHRVRDEKDKHQSLLKEQKTGKYNESQRIKLLSLQRRYQDCLDEVGTSHIEAAMQPNPDLVLAAEHDHRRAEAVVRGREATENLRVEIEETNEKYQVQQHQRKLTRRVENLRSSMVASIPCKRLVESCDRTRHRKTHPKEVSVTVIKSLSPIHKLPVGTSTTNPVKTASSVLVSDFVPPLVEVSKDDASNRDIDEPKNESSQSHRVQFISNISNYSGSTSRSQALSINAKERDKTLHNSKEEDNIKGRHKDDRIAVILHQPDFIKDKTYNHLVEGIHTETPCDESSSKMQVVVDVVAEDDLAASQFPRVRTEFHGLTYLSNGRISPHMESADIRSPCIPMLSSPPSPCLTQQDQGHENMVHFYDHSTRFERQYCAVDLVEKVNNRQPNACEAAEVEMALSQAASHSEIGSCDRSRYRGQRALAKERVHHEYHQLLRMLSGLVREERLKRAGKTSSLSADVFSNDMQRNELSSRRQKRMDSAFESVYHSSSPPKTGTNSKDELYRDAAEVSTVVAQGWHLRSADQETPVKLNVAHWGPPAVSPSPPDGTPTQSSPASDSIVIGQVPQALGETVQANHRIASQQHNVKSLLERIHIQRSLLLEEARLGALAPTLSGEKNLSFRRSSNTPQPSTELHVRGLEVTQIEEKDRETGIKTRLCESKVRGGHQIGIEGKTKLDMEECGRESIYSGKGHTSGKIKLSNRRITTDKVQKDEFYKEKQDDNRDLHAPRKMELNSTKGEKNQAVVSEYSVDLSLSHTLEQSYTSFDDSSHSNSNTTLVEGLKIKVNVTEKAKVSSKKKYHKSPSQLRTQTHKQCRRNCHKKVKSKMNRNEVNGKEIDVNDKGNQKVGNTSRLKTRDVLPEGESSRNEYVNVKMTCLNKNSLGKKNQSVCCKKCSIKGENSILIDEENSRINYPMDINKDHLQMDRMIVNDQAIPNKDFMSKSNAREKVRDKTCHKEKSIASNITDERLQTLGSNNQQKWGEELFSSPMNYSGSTSYFSPPDYLHASPNFNVECFKRVVNRQREQGIPVDPRLTHYIARLLYMSRASVAELDVSSSDVSTPSTEIIESSLNIVPISVKKPVEHVLPTTEFKNKCNCIPSNKVEEQHTELHAEIGKTTRTVGTNVCLCSLVDKDRFSQSEERRTPCPNEINNNSQITEYLQPPDKIYKGHFGVAGCDDIKQKELLHTEYYMKQQQVPQGCEDDKSASWHELAISKEYDNIQVVDSRPKKQHKSEKEREFIDVGNQVESFLSSPSEDDISHISGVFGEHSKRYNVTCSKEESHCQMPDDIRVKTNISSKHYSNVKLIGKATLSLTSPNRAHDQNQSHKLPEVFKEYTNLTDQCSQRISDLALMIDNIRREKQRLIDIEAGYRYSSTSSPETVSHSPDVEFHSDSCFDGGTTSESMPTTTWSTTVRNMPPDAFHHQLSTIIEVDTPQISHCQNTQQESTFHNVSMMSMAHNDTNTQGPFLSSPFRNILSINSPESIEDNECNRTMCRKSSNPDKSHVGRGSTHLVGKIKEGTAFEPTDRDEVHTEGLNPSTNEDFPDIMTEMLRRELLTSPFSWMKKLPLDSNNGQHWDSMLSDDDSSALSDPLFESTDIPITYNQQTVQSAPPSPRKKDKLSQLSSIYPSIHIQSTDDSISKDNPIPKQIQHIQHGLDSSPEDLETAFQRLGIGWASAMLRKTQETMAMSSSSSDNSLRPQLLGTSRSKAFSRLIDFTLINPSKDIRGHSTPIVLSDVHSASSACTPHRARDKGYLSFSDESRISTVNHASPNGNKCNFQIRTPNISLVSKPNVTDTKEYHSSRDSI